MSATAPSKIPNERVHTQQKNTLLLFNSNEIVCQIFFSTSIAFLSCFIPFNSGFSFFSFFHFFSLVVLVEFSLHCFLAIACAWRYVFMCVFGWHKKITGKSRLGRMNNTLRWVKRQTKSGKNERNNMNWKGGKETSKTSNINDNHTNWRYAGIQTFYTFNEITQQKGTKCSFLFNLIFGVFWFVCCALFRLCNIVVFRYFCFCFVCDQNKNKSLTTHFYSKKHFFFSKKKSMWRLELKSTKWYTIQSILMEMQFTDIFFHSVKEWNANGFRETSLRFF